MLACRAPRPHAPGHAFTLIEGRAEDLPADIGSFDVVTIGRACIGWTRRARPMFARLVAPEGVIVVCASFSPPARPQSWLETTTPRGALVGRKPPVGIAKRASERTAIPTAALEGTGFHAGEKIRVEATHQVSVSDLAQRVLTLLVLAGRARRQGRCHAGRYRSAALAVRRDGSSAIPCRRRPENRAAPFKALRSTRARSARPASAGSAPH